MKLKLAIALVVAPMLLAGCAGAAIDLRSTNSPSIPGSTPALGGAYSSSAIQVDVTPGAFFGMAFLRYLVGGVQDEYRRWNDGASSRRPPELAEGHAIAERDCSQPLEPLYPNLRCR